MALFAKGAWHPRTWLPPAALLLAACFAVAVVVTEIGPKISAAAEEANTLLRVPEADYRRDWTLLGTFSVLADDPAAGAKESHVVYMRPENVDAYRTTGAFPDGAILVKDVFATSTDAMTTGTVSYANTLVGRFVMVKDGTDKHAAASPLWGDGWGWAFYEGAETRKTVTTDYRNDCLGCHEPARDQDLTYVQGYPILKN